ncbi:LppM family (lipo)protein [Demequina globuliformis]|uniref:LppM family (lipo)protein n=1 Tax=Demequina globuliformis TaxID=676202 RepID=UPI0007807B9E|nr:hypothetical protein [Demequina globuliformis]
MDRIRLALSAAAVATGVLALTGCVRATAETTFHEDETFSQHAIVAYEPSVADELTDRLGVDVNAVVGTLDESDEFLALQAQYPGQIELADYSEGEMSGLELTLTDLPLEAFEDASGEVLKSVGATASIAVEDGSYVISVRASTDDALALMALGESQLGLIEQTVNVQATFTFPGPVTEATAGDVTGNTVTLGLADLATTPEIRIVAGATPSIPWGTIGTWAAIIAGFAVVIGGATALVIQDRRASKRTHLPPPVVRGDSDDHGSGGAPSADSPPR